MDEYVEKNPRLGIQDKRYLFQALLAMTERLLYLNKFPVDMEDFALSLQTPEVEAAWLLIRQDLTKGSTAPAGEQFFECYGIKWKLHLYPEDKKTGSGHNYGRVFMNVSKPIGIDRARRHLGVVKVWAKKQQRLEEQLLRSARVLKAIVHACNTVGQYKRVSPDLLGFLPEKYRRALQDYTKASPYPEMSVEPHQIDTTISTLAFAALQPQHHSETEFVDRRSWSGNHYNLESFPRSKAYDGEDVRKHQL